MAKKKDINKTQAIKDALANDPKVSPKALSESLTKSGIEVTPGYVSTIKSELNKGKTKKKKGRRSAPGRKASANGKSSNAQDLISLTGLVEARKFADQLGGIDEARHVLDALSKLSP